MDSQANNTGNAALPVAPGRRPRPELTTLGYAVFVIFGVIRIQIFRLLIRIMRGL
jgi:hypothetical protein